MKKLQDNMGYPPRGMNADRAAAYCDLSRNSFLAGVDSGEWPAPKQTSGGPRWDRVELDAAWDAKQHRERKSSARSRRVGFDDLMEKQDGDRETPVREPV